MFNDFNTFVFYAINRSCSVKILDVCMPYVTRLSDASFLFLVSLGLLIFKRYRKTGLLMLAGLTCSFYVVDYLKNWFAHPRPFEILTGVNLLVKDGGYSFPSGHTTRAFMAAYLLSSNSRRYYLFYILAIVAGISRIYLGVHFPLDVLTGACLGIVIGYLLIKAAGPISPVSDPEICKKGSDIPTT
ncbi:MAG: hypothetical protein A2Z72_06985 [Omnitrophica bacterium RBG_13_46_9]|nr:MAG: hypothetical protein A2Z72_06985 [Omnitrophica bacterium RBG_13_46_9]